jgi:hypothetical protein
MYSSSTLFEPPVSRPYALSEEDLVVRRVRAPASRFVRLWLGLALGSLLLAGLLSLSVVLGRLPGLSRIIDDPLFFKRCLVVHVDLALVVWFYAFACSLAALRVANRAGVVEWFAFGTSVVGVVGMLAGGLVRGAAPVLANYIPVIDHPLFLGGLGLFFTGVLVFTLRTVNSRITRSQGKLSKDATVGVQACGVALVLAAVTWVSARSALPAGLDRHTFFEFSHWGAGHVLQVANICGMLAVWLWLVARVTGGAVLSAAAARVLFAALLAPHLIMPLLSWQGALHRTYIEGATLLMRWGIFPVVLFTLCLCVRYLLRYSPHTRSAETRMMTAGFGASVGLTLLGFVLGAMIRSSTTLVPAHYHASLGGITAAFMTATYLLIEVFGRDAKSTEAIAKRWRSARRQLLCFGGGQAVFAIGFAIGGVYGLGRKTYAGEQHVRSLGEQIGLGVMGLGGLVAAAGGVWFLILVLRPFCTRRRHARVDDSYEFPVNA